ncbi:Protein of unknown function [Pyronema omphalodes CBS 100304]|uniref:Uncharacterized protein n=1 Tax=Pyronema omphalodes (strain CBS 100304) TaxID=1076935 RepID=U4LQ19_PYROM|nr:Protein of unknown function [Pyronema omphalodes CBS 100304]
MLERHRDNMPGCG